jgi:hypothetical protein
VGTSIGGAMFPSGTETYVDFGDNVNNISSESGLGRLGRFETGIVGGTVCEFVRNIIGLD